MLYYQRHNTADSSYVADFAQTKQIVFQDLWFSSATASAVLLRMKWKYMQGRLCITGPIMRVKSAP